MILTDEKRHQLVSYIVHAGKILTKEKHLPKKIYQHAYIPSWSELYTGYLKAAWYLFLDKSLKNICIISQQKEYPNDIMYYWEQEKFLIWWREIHNIWITETKRIESIPWEIYDQLLYLRLLTQCKTVIILWIWENINTKDATKKLNEILKTEYWIICISTNSKQKSRKKSKNEDLVMIEHVLSKKIYKPNPNRLGNTYINIIKKYKKKSELISYVHTSDFDIPTTNEQWYICMVA